jgi:Leucine-rich repeat (LRR) protein
MSVARLVCVLAIMAFVCQPNAGCSEQESRRARGKELLQRLEGKGGRVTRKRSGTESTVVELDLLAKDIEDNDLKGIEVLQDLESLELSVTLVTDRSCRMINKCTHLRELSLSGTDISDEGIRNLRGLLALEDLRLSNTRVTDQSLEIIAKFPALKTLHLSRTKVTAEGLSHLRQAKNLRTLLLNDTHITNRGLAPISRISTLLSVAQRRLNFLDR